MSWRAPWPLWRKTNYGRRPENPGRSTALFSACLKLDSCCVWTMHLRVQHSCASALHIASPFSAHPKIERVFYPGLADHPIHEIAKRQMRGGYSRMMSIQVDGGRDAELRVAKVARLFIPVASRACWNIAQPSKVLTVRFPIIFCASVSVSKMSAILLQTSNGH